MAPEMVEGNYTEKADIFSIGLMVYQLLTGIHPLSGRVREVARTVLTGVLGSSYYGVCNTIDVRFR